MISNNKSWLFRRWKHLWTNPSLIGSHQSAAFPWDFVNIARTRLERLVARLRKRDYPHYGPKAKIPELFHRRDTAFFALRSGQLHFDRASQPKDCFDLLDLATSVGALESRLGYTFKDRMLCLRALKVDDAPIPLYWSGTMLELSRNNRLALLGDRVLALAICEIWYNTEHSTKSYSQMDRATLSRDALAVTALKICLDKTLLRGDSLSRTAGSAVTSRNYLAEGFEAVIGAVYVDSGYNLKAVKTVIQKLQLDQHRSLKTWEQMTESQRLRTVAESTNAGKQQDAKQGDSYADHATKTTRAFSRPSEIASNLDVGKTRYAAKATDEALSLPLQEILRDLEHIPAKLRVRREIQRVVELASLDSNPTSGAAVLALRRYVDLFKGKNIRSRRGPEHLYETILEEQQLFQEHDLEGGAVRKKEKTFTRNDLAHATVVKEVPATEAALITEDPESDLVESKEAVNLNDWEATVINTSQTLSAWRNIFICKKAPLSKEERAIRKASSLSQLFSRVIGMYRVLSKSTIEVSAIAEAKRPRGWVTFDQLQLEAGAYIHSPEERLFVASAGKYSSSISRAIELGLSLGSAEWNQFVAADFHHAIRVHLVVDTLLREGHLESWRKEAPDSAKFLFAQEMGLVPKTAFKLLPYDGNAADISGRHTTTELIAHAFAALETKLVSNTSTSNAQTTPWEEAVREAVRKQENERMREVGDDMTPVRGKERKRLADEEIVHMVKTENVRMEKQVMKDISRVRAYQKAMVAWRKERTTPRSYLILKEDEALKSRDKAIKILPRSSQIFMMLEIVWTRTISATRDLISFGNTRNLGGWSPHPPMNLEELQIQVKDYCESMPGGPSKWGYSKTYHHTIGHAIGQGSRIGSKKWNEVVETYFHRSMKIEIAFRHAWFPGSLEVQSAAVDLERQFDERLTGMLRSDPSTPLSEAEKLLVKVRIFSGKVPSQMYSGNQIRDRVPDESETRLQLITNDELTGILQRKPRATDLPATSAMQASIPSPSASMPIFLHVHTKGSLTNAHAQGANSRNLSGASERASAATLPVMVMLESPIELDDATGLVSSGKAALPLTGSLAIMTKPEDACALLSSDTVSGRTENNSEQRSTQTLRPRKQKPRRRGRRQD